MAGQVDIRRTLLEVIDAQRPKRPGDGNIQSTGVLIEVARRLGAVHNHPLEEAILTVFHDLFRTGYLAWGYNLSNPNPPFFHLTEIGRRSLARLSRDPGNPEGYLAHVATLGIDNDVALSYLREALSCYVADLPKAAAVMVGAAAESLTLEVRDSVVGAIETSGQKAPASLSDWRIKVILDALRTEIDSRTKTMPRDLRDRYSAYWPAFTQQIRAIRNDAGHPNDINAISLEAVHASLLVFPELGDLSTRLRSWIGSSWGDK